MTMIPRILPSLPLTALLIAAGCLTPALAHASDEIPSEEEGTFGEQYSLLDIAGMAASGTRRGAGDVDYTRKGGQLEYRIGGFFEQDYFKTLIGLEGQFALGYQGENAFGAPPPAAAPVPGQPAVAAMAPYGNQDTSAFYLRADALFTYGLFHWNKVMRGRIVMGAGGGFEAASRLRGGEGGEGYALLLGRLQLWPSESLGLHFSASTTVGSYRLEALGSLDGWTLGARARWLNATRADLTQERQLEIIAGMMF
jgi:hypothetical protein